MYIKSLEELNECAKSQEQFCKENKLPYYAPENGICYRCKLNIYQNYQVENGASYGWSRDNQLITGCSHCNMSYCD
jgi:hypothetical protein